MRSNGIGKCRSHCWYSLRDYSNKTFYILGKTPHPCASRLMKVRNTENCGDSPTCCNKLFFYFRFIFFFFLKSLWLFCPEAISCLWTCSAQHAVVEGQAHYGLLVAAVLPLDLACLHAPQAGQVVRGRCWIGTHTHTHTVSVSQPRYSMSQTGSVLKG